MTRTRRYCRCELRMIERPGRDGLFCPNHGSPKPQSVVVAIPLTPRVPEDAEVERVQEQWKVGS